MAVRIGADPEILLVNKHGDFHSVEGLVGGTRDKPVRIPDTTLKQFKDGYAMQEDNVMLEFNIRPRNNWHDFIHGIEWALDKVHSAVAVPNGLEFSESPTGFYEADQLMSGQAATFGCLPDLDAWSREQATPVSTSTLGNWRCAGGHIHLGYDNPANVPPFVVARLADALIGLWEVHFRESQGIRRQNYGTAGRYREKPYGIEYRTMSNNWLFHADMLHMAAHGASKLANMIERGNMAEIQGLYTEIPMGEVQRAINTEDGDLARKLTRFITEVENRNAY